MVNQFAMLVAFTKLNSTPWWHDHNRFYLTCNACGFYKAQLDTWKCPFTILDASRNDQARMHLEFWLLSCQRRLELFMQRKTGKLWKLFKARKHLNPQKSELKREKKLLKLKIRKIAQDFWKRYFKKHLMFGPNMTKD